LSYAGNKCWNSQCVILQSLRIKQEHWLPQQGSKEQMPGDHFFATEDKFCENPLFFAKTWSPSKVKPGNWQGYTI